MGCLEGCNFPILFRSQRARVSGVRRIASIARPVVRRAAYLDCGKDSFDVSTASQTATSQTAATSLADVGDGITIDLRDRWLAAFLAWLVPGLGHFYQRRWGKGGLFMTCILATFFYGLWLGGGRVVYASFRHPEWREWRWAYVAQVGVGLPALPAVVQSMRTGSNPPKAPFFDGKMAPPIQAGDIVSGPWLRKQNENYPDDVEYDLTRFESLDGGAYYRFAPRTRPNDAKAPDQLSEWNRKLGTAFDLGTVFTMIAGLLNVLVIWDAWGGPLLPLAKVEKDETKETNQEKKAK